jgi:hypothetical protein
MASSNLMVVALLLGACTGGSEMIAESAQPTTVQLRLRGIATSEYSAVLVKLKDVRVTADGQKLAVTPPKRLMNLADTSVGWIAGEVTMPAWAKSIHIAITLDDFGAFESAGGNGEIEARTRPIEFDASLENVAIHHKAVVLVDLERSLLAIAADRKVLLPVLSVAY